MAHAGYFEKLYLIGALHALSEDLTMTCGWISELRCSTSPKTSELTSVSSKRPNKHAMTTHRMPQHQFRNMSKKMFRHATLRCFLFLCVNQNVYTGKS